LKKTVVSAAEMSVAGGIIGETQTEVDNGAHQGGAGRVDQPIRRRLADIDAFKIRHPTLSRGEAALKKARGEEGKPALLTLQEACHRGFPRPVV
jgi:hypothetical protein